MMVGSTLVVLSLMLGPGPASLGSPASQPGAATPSSTNLNLRFSGAPAAAQAKDAWQREMNAARARKDTGKKLMIFGGIAAVGGTVLGVAAVDSCVNAILYTDSTNCGGQSALSTVGWLVSLGGDVTFVWGLVDFIGANGDISSLNARRSGGHDVAAFNLSPRQRVALEMGHGAKVAYKVRW